MLFGIFFLPRLLIKINAKIGQPQARWFTYIFPLTHLPFSHISASSLCIENIRIYFMKPKASLYFEERLEPWRKIRCQFQHHHKTSVGLGFLFPQKLMAIQQKLFQRHCGFLSNIFRICEEHPGQERRFKTIRYSNPFMVKFRFSHSELI